MRRVALIQNDSELIRYSWADIRPLIASYGYEYEPYTSENIEEIYPRLRKGRYDAILIASNACNDSRILESLVNGRVEIESFLSKGNGLFVSFQVKMPERGEYSFLSENRRLFAVLRDAAEDKLSCSLRVPTEHLNNVLVNYPYAITAEAVASRCRENNLVRGVYWIHLKQNLDSNYDVVLEDADYDPPRPLLVVSKPHGLGRVVVSAIALDWQDHQQLRENVIRYVVEGRPSIGVITRKGHATFDYDYVVTSLATGKIPYREYIKEEIGIDGVFKKIHDKYLLDPGWASAEVDKFIAAVSPEVQSGYAKVFYFRNETSGLSSVAIVSCSKEYQEISRNVISWLVSQYPVSLNEGYWAGSFWSTVDVLSTLILFKYPYEQFRNRILAQIMRKYSKGSYDEVLGATCAMYELFVILLGKDNEKTKAALTWIEIHFSEKTLFERATAYDVLSRTGSEVKGTIVDGFVKEVLAEAGYENNEIKIYRYARTLLTLGRTIEAEAIALHLEKLQNRYDGSWINLAHTASIVELLVDIVRASGSGNDNIEKMIFKGIEHVRSRYDHEACNWGGDISGTTKSIRALRAFEERTRLPIDIMTEAITVSHKGADAERAVNAAIEHNRSVQQKMSEIASLNEKLNTELLNLRRSENSMKKLALYSLAIILVVAMTGIGLFRFMESRSLTHKVFTTLAQYVKTSVGEILGSWFILAVGAVAFLYVLKKLGKLPDIVEHLLSSWLKIGKETQL